MKTKHTASRVDVGLYLYRGFEIYRRDSVASGYYGAWAARYKGKAQWVSTFKEAKAIIDEGEADREASVNL